MLRHYAWLVSPILVGALIALALFLFSLHRHAHADGGILIVGDSVVLGASPALAADLPDATIDAVVGRQFDTVIAQVAVESAGAGTIVVNAGNNGVVTADQIATLLTIAAGRPVFLVNCFVGLWWQDQNNALFWTAAATYPNLTVVDWYDTVLAHPEYVGGDGVHLTGAGVTGFAALVAAALGY